LRSCAARNPENPANLEATQRLANLHDALAEAGYRGHALERYLVRVLFCLFAEDTGIFEPRLFTTYIQTRTREDGSDLGAMLTELFQVLDTPENQRMGNINEDLAAFPYVNGALFAESLRGAAFNRNLRDRLLACCNFRWEKISPAIFGSLFQGVMDDAKRRKIGAHYTSERDIMKLLRALFLDDLQAELHAALADRSTRRLERLREYQRKLRRMRIFDPACGCGNFLILAYRELRRLETQVLVAIYTGQEGIELHLDVRQLAQVDVDQFYGIEIEEWPARIAEVGLWLTDHQCNLELAQALGQSFRRLPLQSTPTLRVENALRADWLTILPPTDSVFILGNPPFVGKSNMSVAQNADMALVCRGIRKYSVLDYVNAWYVKAAAYVAGTNVRCAFVSTNSITQGEQVGIVWGYLFGKQIKIHFGHRTFDWTSEARGRAHVHVVIIGFGAFDVARKRIYDYDGEESATVKEVSNISPYLIEGKDEAIMSRTSPLSADAPKLSFGNMPNDGGFLLLDDEEKRALLAAEPGAAGFIRLFLGPDEFIYGTPRWCLWLEGVAPAALRACPAVLERIEGVRTHRSNSTRDTTNKLAATPALFGEIRQPTSWYLAIPKTSSEKRKYIPMAYLDANVVAQHRSFHMPRC
jgi:type I restriction-modification system DNA methylase subunit